MHAKIYAKIYAKKISIIVLLILPAISIVVSSIAQYSYPDDVNFFIVIFLYLLILFIVTIWYGLYPLLFSKSFFVKVDDKIDKRVIEFEFIKKVLLTGLPILIIAEVFWYFFYYTFMSYNFALLLQAFNISLFFGGLIRLNTQTAKRESGFYFAKGYCKII